MNAKVLLYVQDTNKEDIRSLVQMLREWELKTPRANAVGVFFDTDPEVTSAEAKEIFEDVFPKFEHMAELRKVEANLLRLGTRGVTVEGELLGTCDELTLSIGEASEEEMQKLLEAQTISLVRIGRG